MNARTDEADSPAGGTAPTTDATTAPVSSPASTGGAGTTFEQHVGAYWLAQLLVGAIPPIAIDTTVAEVSFQTKRLGWHTDDFLVICTAAGQPRNLAGQVKRGFIVSATDPGCVQTIAGFWKDFNAPHFSSDRDRFALVTLRGTNTLLQHFVGLLDCARAAPDSDDFEKRLATTGFISEKAVRYCDELRKVIGDVESKLVTAGDIWTFLRTLHVLSLDLHTSTRQTEAHIRSMLALTATDVDPAASAGVSWNELIVEASTAMAAGRTLRRDDLLPATLARHGVIGTNERRVLHALGDHTKPVLRAIRSKLGESLHLPRVALVQELLDSSENAQVVVVTGPAGCGKSAVAKDAVRLLAAEHFVFGFRVEEFAQAHLDATLDAAQVPANWTTLSAVLGAQDRKVVLVESVERLLEKTTRDAFTDLITLAAADGGLRILLTCRDYSVEQVRTSFLKPYGINYTVVRVPLLADAELREAEVAYPPLAIPLRSPALRDILRNPFVLDKAIGIQWSPEKPLPQTERELRALFWREIVRGGDRVVPAMARPREEVLQTIAVRRARALSPHVPATDLDAVAIDSLHGDSLITSSDDNPLLVATAHDVLEDWAILQWLEEQHLSGASFKTLSEAIGTHPAMRRSYRKWVAELVERNSAAADQLFRAALSEAEMRMQFRDDTLVSLLKAPSAPAFLQCHEAQLLASDRTLLKRVIHLLRVACVKTPDWIAPLGRRVSSILNVPDGSAWPAVLRLVHRSLAAFTDNERTFLLGLVEDAVRGVSSWAPDLDGAEDVAGIAHWLLDGLRGYGGEEPRKRVLKVIARIPKGDAARFEATLRSHIEVGERRDVVAEDFQGLIYTGTDGMPAARDLPDVVVSVGADYLLASEEDINDERRYRRRPGDIELYFGIKEGLRGDSFPASAVRGPWCHLLRYHSEKALNFYIKVFNHSADWYANPRLYDPLEEAWGVELTFADGTTRKQWTNSRLWRSYRGMVVAPYRLQSMLMALEIWLLEVGKREPERLDPILVDILRRTDNSALAAVVASVATAYPQASGEALLGLLSVRDYVVLDRDRVAGEHHMATRADMFPAMNAEDHVYGEERKQADALTHRKDHLETAAIKLQFGPFAPRVHDLLDNHLAAMPQREQQDEGDRLWRLAIHRMDLRQYSPSDTIGPEISDPQSKAGGSPRHYVRLDLAPPEADLQAMVDEGGSDKAAMNTRFGLLIWGRQAFRRETGQSDSAQWAARLSQAQAMNHQVGADDISRHALGLVAAVCIRDRWDDMTSAQREWCVDRVCTEVMRDADDTDHMRRGQSDPMAADRACASVLATLLRRPLDPTRTERVKTAFATALTHPVDQVRSYAAWGIDDTIWATDRALALRCVNAIASEAASIDAALQAEKARPHGERRGLDEIVIEAKADIRARFWKDGGIPDDAHVTPDISYSNAFGAHALKRILAIFGRVPQDPIAVAAFDRASHALAGWWTSDADRGTRRERHYHTESEVSERIQGFLLRTSPDAARWTLAPLLAAVDRHSRELKAVMQGLTRLQDTDPNAPQYWSLWKLIADAVRGASWIARLDTDRHPHGTHLLSAVFLTLDWKDEVRHWRFLDGHAHLVHALFEDLPPSSIVLYCYARFLYHIGQRSLPEAFVRIADALQRGNPQKMLANSDTVFVFEVLLQRHVYGRPLELKRETSVRNAVLSILDCLVEAGSSAAFRMRDDFVTPAA